MEYFLGLMERGEDFVLEQAPDLVQQILAWERALYCTGYCFGVVFVVSTCLLIYTNRKKIVRAIASESKYSDVWFISTFFLASFVVIACVGMLVELSTFIQLWVAPKVFLLEYMSSLIK